MCVCLLWEMLSFYKFLITFLCLISPTACFILYWVLVSCFVLFWLNFFLFVLLIILLLKFSKDLYNRLTILKYFLCLETIIFVYRGVSSSLKSSQAS